MTTITFDTHAFVKKLKAVGFTEEQAKVFAEEQARLIEDKLATKQDLIELKSNLKRDMKELEYRIVIKARRFDGLLHWRGRHIGQAVVNAIISSNQKARSSRAFLWALTWLDHYNSVGKDSHSPIADFFGLTPKPRELRSLQRKARRRKVVRKPKRHKNGTAIKKAY